MATSIGWPIMEALTSQSGRQRPSAPWALTSRTRSSHCASTSRSSRPTASLKINFFVASQE